MFKCCYLDFVYCDFDVDYLVFENQISFSCHLFLSANVRHNRLTMLSTTAGLFVFTSRSLSLSSSSTDARNLLNPGRTASLRTDNDKTRTNRCNSKGFINTLSGITCYFREMGKPRKTHQSLLFSYEYQKL